MSCRGRPRQTQDWRPTAKITKCGKNSAVLFSVDISLDYCFSITTCHCSRVVNVSRARSTLPVLFIWHFRVTIATIRVAFNLRTLGENEKKSQDHQRHVKLPSIAFQVVTLIYKNLARSASICKIPYNRIYETPIQDHKIFQKPRHEGSKDQL